MAVAEQDCCPSGEGRSVKVFASELLSGDHTGRRTLHRRFSERHHRILVGKYHQHVRYAKWKGLALARVQVGLAIVMINTLTWHKIIHNRLEPMPMTPAV